MNRALSILALFKSYVLTTLLLMASLPLFAQRTGIIRGRVETNDGKPLPYASVALRDTRYGTMANDRGQFQFEAPGGTYTLVVSYAGYETSEKRVTVTSGTTVNAGVLVVNSGSNQLREVIVADIQKNKFQRSKAAQRPECLWPILKTPKCIM